MASNFTQALKELTGFGEVEESKNININDVFEAQFSNEDISAQELPKEPINMNSDNSDFVGHTHITDSMVINGNIKSEDDILIDGIVYGDVATTKSLRMTNLIIGNVKSENMLLNAARLKGNIKVSNNVNVEQASVIVGDINANNVRVAGNVKGNIDCVGTCYLLGSAHVIGDVQGTDITTEPGLKFKGNIITKYDPKLVDEDELFDIGGDF